MFKYKVLSIYPASANSKKNITIRHHSRHITSTEQTLNNRTFSRLFRLKLIKLRWVINICLTTAVLFITSIYYSGQYSVTVFIVLHLVKKLCAIFLYLLNIIIIVNFFVWGQHRVFVNSTTNGRLCVRYRLSTFFWGRIWRQKVFLKVPLPSKLRA